MTAVSGAWDAGTTALDLNGGRGLGREGAARLAELLLAAPPPRLASLDLRLRPALAASLHASEGDGALGADRLRNKRQRHRYGEGGREGGRE